MLAIIEAIVNDMEKNAIEHIFEQYYPRMKMLAMKILHNEYDAEDAAMDAMSYMCQHAEHFLDYTSSRTVSLIFLCVRSAAVDLYRRKKCRNEHTVYCDEDEHFIENIPDDGLSVIDIIITRENRELLIRAIGTLNDMYQIPILLRYNHQMRNTEIAELLHIDVNTVNGRIFRAKIQLKKCLKEMGYTYE